MWSLQVYVYSYYTAREPHSKVKSRVAFASHPKTTVSDRVVHGSTVYSTKNLNLPPVMFSIYFPYPSPVVVVGSVSHTLGQSLLYPLFG